MGTSQVTAMFNDVVPAASSQTRWNSNAAAGGDKGFDRLLEGRGTAREEASPRRAPADAAGVKLRRDGQAGKTQRQKPAARADSVNAGSGREETPAEVESRDRRAGGNGETGKGIEPAPGGGAQEEAEINAATIVEREGHQAALAAIGMTGAPAEVSGPGTGEESADQVGGVTVAQLEPEMAAQSGEEIPEGTATAGAGESEAAAGNPPQTSQAEQQGGANGNAEPVRAQPHGTFFGRSVASAHDAAKEEPPGLSRAAAVIEENRERQSLKRAETGKEEQRTPAQEGSGPAEGGEGMPVDARSKIEVKKEAEQRPVALQEGETAEAVVSEPSAEKKGPQQFEQRDGKLEMSNADDAEQKNAATELSGGNPANGEDATAANAAAKEVRQKAGGKGSGDAAGKEHQEAKAPVKLEGEIPATAFTNQTAAAEGTAPEAKGGGRSALHESILSQVKGGVVSYDGKGNGQVSIRLKPDELGELKIQVRMEDNRLRVEVQADNRAVKDLLMSNLDTLKEALSGKNLAMEGFNVSTGGGFDNSLPGQREGGRPSAQRARRSGYQGEGGEGRVVKYLTGDVDSLLDVRF